MIEPSPKLNNLNYLGIDPGHISGGIVLTSSTATLAACTWQRLRRKSGDTWRVDVEVMSSPKPTVHRSHFDGSSSAILGNAVVRRTYHASYWEAIDSIWSVLPCGAYHLAVEDMFIPHGRGMMGLVKLIESAGGLMATFAPAALSVKRPRANAWRKAILGIGGRVCAADAEKEAIEWAKNNANLGRLQKNGHVCEAAAIAKWCQRNAPSHSPTLAGQ